MKPSRLLVLPLFLISSIIFAQNDQLNLRSGTIRVKGNMRQAAIDSFNSRAARFQDKAFAVLQFEQIPSERSRKMLSDQGIELLEYIPDHAYTAVIRGRIALPLLQQVNAKAIIQLDPKQKLESRLATGVLPSWAIRIPGTIDVWVSFPKTFAGTDVITELRRLNIDLISSAYASYRILSLRIATNRLSELASLPFIEYVQPAPPGDQLLNTNSRTGSRANVLNAAIADGGKGLNGEGVVVGVGDNADVQTHIDFSRRLIDRSAQLISSGHGHHTTGTVAGAGNGNELYRGYAPKATIVSQAFNGIIMNAATYVNDYGMVITNNSYGDNIECGYFGTYDLYARLLDRMAIDLPNLQNVFSAGNSGGAVCSPFLPGYHTVLGGYQSAKNVISVGATTDSGAVSAFSSRGPVKDGRIKPEVVAMGQFVGSTWSGNIYGYNNGTSMAGPAVAGGLALLYQRYRQLNAGSNPRNALMKALICNGALDRGNSGPDFQYGFGWMNLLRSIEMLEANHYVGGTIANGATVNSTISIPANTTQVKFLLYWNDPEASMLSAHTLVNDLDLEVVDPSSGLHLPVVLDTSNAALGNPASTGADHINNIEQVVINSPVAGNYTVRVKGTAITQNPTQEYFLVYDPIPVQLKITSPIGGESWAPTTSALDMMKVSWEADGYTGTATIQLSTDNWSSWSTIAAGVDVKRMVYTWWVPNIATSQALVRITKDGTGEQATSNSFTIVAAPTISLDPVQCDGYITLDWTSVTGATDYEVFMLDGEGMKSLTTTTANSYTIGGLSKDSVYWVSVRSRVNGKGGRRAIAIFRQPNTGTCAGSVSDNDLRMEAIVAPVSGRKFTSTQLSASTTVTVRIKNLDDAPANSFDIKYSINGGSFISETVSTPLAAGATSNYSFTTTADLSATGNYSIVAVVKNNTADVVTSNDTAVVLVRQIDNAPLTLTSAFLDDIESAAPAVYGKDTIGLTGADRYDFSTGTVYGRLRTFLNSGIAYSGSNAITLDVNQYYAAGNTNYLTGTFNLGAYNNAVNDLRLDFQFNNHGQQAHPNNRVWIRGSDTQPWIEAYDLDANENEPGLYKKTASIELSDLLAANGQNFGTSFQVKWGQFGKIAATDKENAAGYSFDDIHLYEVHNDLQMLSIDEPVAASCGLTSSAIIKISVRNSDNATINSIPLKYRINNGSWVSETLASMSGNTTVQYSFTTGANLSAPGTYNIDALVDYPGDSFRDDDTVHLTIVNTPVISSFPYLQNFETDNGYWYAQGKHSSWEYGTPVSAKINRAASGIRAWKTRLAGNYNDNEQSYVYSPCFDISAMTNPTLSFSLAMDAEDCGAQLCDGAWVEYSADGVNWLKLGTSGTGTNWYNKAGAQQLWSIQDDTRWHVATVSLPGGLNRLRLRFVMSSDPAVNREGMAFDDVHIYDNVNGIYDGVTMAGPVTQTVSGNNWIDFISGGKLVASIQPNNQNLGVTDVQAFINTSAVRHTVNQYYHDRNITIKPAATSQADSVSIRFYFLDAEVNNLLNATGCPGCTKPASAYDLGVSKYTDPDKSFENGTVGDDNQGIWNFVTSNWVTKVPFDKGYYAEFRVKDFSEFWLNNGGLTGSIPLPVKLLDFTAQKGLNEEVVLKWSVATEANVAAYEIELARGNAELQAGHYLKIGSVTSLGNSTTNRNYSFTDNEADKFGPRYYRLKIVNLDGSFSYSPIRSVLFNETVLGRVYPNPSTGFFNLVFQIDAGNNFEAKVFDVKGSLVREYHRTATGLLQKLSIDLSAAPAGMYLLQTDAAGKRQAFKLYKN